MKGQVKILMCEYVKEIVAAWDKVQKAPVEDGFQIVVNQKKRNKTCAALKDLFNVDSDSEKFRS